MTKPLFRGAAHVLEPADLDDAAARLRVDRATVVAVMSVETGGAGGFLSDGSGRPRILFEAHQFGRLTGSRWNASHPTLSTRSWDRALYLGGAAEYGRLEAAMALDEAAALQATSWGLFQIMGFNHQMVGYPTITQFVGAMADAEQWHLRAFIAFIEASGAARALRGRDWHEFARIYNGPGFAANRYPEKLAAAWRRAGGGGVNPPRPRLTLSIGASGDAVRLLQERLRRDEPHLVADGIFGPATQAAVVRFQRRVRLEADGIVGPRTAMALAERAEGSPPGTGPFLQPSKVKP